MHFAGNSIRARQVPLRGRVFGCNLQGTYFFGSLHAQKYVPNAPSWNYHWLVGAFGRVEDVAQAIRSAGVRSASAQDYSPPLRRQRDSVPGLWAPLLIDLAMRNGLLKRISELAES